MNNTVATLANNTWQQSKRNPFWIVSILAHLALLVPLYYWQVSLPEQKQVATQRTEARQLAEKAFISSIESQNQKLDSYRHQAEELAEQSLSDVQLKKLAQEQKQQLSKMIAEQQKQPSEALSENHLKQTSELASTVDYLQSLQALMAAQKLLDNSDLTVSEALEMVEYKDLANLSLPPIETLAELQQLSSRSSQQAGETLQQMLEQVQTSESGMSIDFGAGGGSFGQGSTADAAAKGVPDNRSGIGGLMESIGDRLGRTGRDLNYYDEAAPEQINQQFATESGEVGNILGSMGSKTDKVYIDTWYMIGPFEHNSADDRQQAWPPEARVHLDDQFVGKDNRLVSWQYFKTNTYPLEPEGFEDYATWYGYTEVYLDQAQPLWVSAGCDDYCKIWLNDRLAWESGDYQKPWYTNGGYLALTDRIKTWSLSEDKQKMQFKQGKNTLMFRLDNGYGHMFMSLVISAQ